MQYQIVVNTLIDYVDLFICETMSTIAESKSAVEAATTVMKGELSNLIYKKWCNFINLKRKSHFNSTLITNVFRRAVNWYKTFTQVPMEKGIFHFFSEVPFTDELISYAPRNCVRIKEE